MDWSSDLLGKRVIIMDECDSILYNRDRVGAIMGAEINHLLREIERFDGVCILTSNRPIELDPALERRIALKLEFPKPSKEIREQIWKKLIPKKAPIGKDVDLAVLAEYELTGGQIKNALLTAARLACSTKAASINKEHFDVGIKRELLGKEAWNQSRKYTPLTMDSTLNLASKIAKRMGEKKDGNKNTAE